MGVITETTKSRLVELENEQHKAGNFGEWLGLFRCVGRRAQAENQRECKGQNSFPVFHFPLSFSDNWNQCYGPAMDSISS